MTFWEFSTQGEKYYFCMEGSTQDEIEPTQGEIEHQNKHQHKHPSWGLGVGARVGAWAGGDHNEHPSWWEHGPEGGWGVGAREGDRGPIWYPISPVSYIIPYLVYHPLSGIPSPIWYPIPNLVSHLPYLVSHLPLSGIPSTNESPKWNSSLLDIFQFRSAWYENSRPRHRS